MNHVRVGCLPLTSSINYVRYAYVVANVTDTLQHVGLRTGRIHQLVEKLKDCVYVESTVVSMYRFWVSSIPASFPKHPVYYVVN